MDREGDLAAWRHLINHHHPLSGNGGDHKFTFIHFWRCNFTLSTSLSQVTIKSFSLHSDSDSRHAASQIFGPTVPRRRKLGQRMPLQPESTSSSIIHPSVIQPSILRILQGQQQPENCTNCSRSIYSSLKPNILLDTQKHTTIENSTATFSCVLL